MRRFLVACCSATLLAATCATVQPAHAQTRKPAPPVPGKTVAQTLALLGLASKFYAATKAARLDSLLNQPTVPTTVFVPTNAAFARLEATGLGRASTTGQGLDPHQLELLLRFHVVPGRYPSEALKAGQTLRTLNSAFALKVSGQAPHLFVSGTNTAPVELANAYIVCNNGVIHLIEEVLIPFKRAASAHSDSR